MNASKIAPLFIALLLAACAKDTPQALGTLEYDRVALPAPVAEHIVAIDVHEGQQVEAGARLLTLERTRTEAQTEAAQAEAQRQREALGELEAGARRNRSRRHARRSPRRRRPRAMRTPTTRACDRSARASWSPPRTWIAPAPPHRARMRR